MTRRQSDDLMVLSGMLLFAGIYSLFQDFLGLDGYIAWLKAHWIDGWIGVVFGATFVFVSQAIKSYARKATIVG